MPVNALVYHHQLCVYTGTRRPQELPRRTTLWKTTKQQNHVCFIRDIDLSKHTLKDLCSLTNKQTNKQNAIVSCVSASSGFSSVWTWGRRVLTTVLFTSLHAPQLNTQKLRFPGLGFFPLSKLRSGQYTDTTGHKDDHNSVIAADSQMDVCRRRPRPRKPSEEEGTLGHWDGLWVIERHLVHRSRTPQGANSMCNTSDFLSNQ